MDLVPADIESLSASADANAFGFPPPQCPSTSDIDSTDLDERDNPNSSIASLMQISEKMDSLLPVELPATHVPIYDPAPNVINIPPLSTTHTYTDATNSSCSFTNHHQQQQQHLPATPAPSPLALPIQTQVHSMYPVPPSHMGAYYAHQRHGLLRNINHLVQHKYVHSPTPTSTSTISPIQSPLPPQPVSKPTSNAHTAAHPVRSSLKLSPKVLVNSISQATTTLHSHRASQSPYPTAPALSPCSVRDVSASFTTSLSGAPERRARSKTSRKPKTYTKPVASRFCHICSRTPRRGHSAAVCSRMSQGLCRKIVCEQCFREQGWDFEATQKNPSSWRCPHCTDVCPARSQCHIYNRINARRKRKAGSDCSGQPTKRTKTPSKAMSPSASPTQQTRNVTAMEGRKQHVKVERVLTMEHGAMWA